MIMRKTLTLVLALFLALAPMPARAARTFAHASSQYLSAATPGVTSMPITLSGWVNIASLYGQNQAVVCLGSNTTNNNRYYLLVTTSGATGALAKASSTAVQATSTSTLSTGSWHHVCAVFTSSTSRAAYLDGGNKGTDATSASPSSAAITSTFIGRCTSSTTDNYMEGTIAQCAVWNVALTDPEVASLATGLTPLHVRPNNLVHYWPLESRASPEIDFVGGLTLTLQASPTIGDNPRTIHLADVAEPIVWWPERKAA
jgi:hypothetical protein